MICWFTPSLVEPTPGVRTRAVKGLYVFNLISHGGVVLGGSWCPFIKKPQSKNKPRSERPKWNPCFVITEMSLNLNCAERNWSRKWEFCRWGVKDGHLDGARSDDVAVLWKPFKEIDEFLTDGMSGSRSPNAPGGWKSVQQDSPLFIEPRLKWLGRFTLSDSTTFKGVLAGSPPLSPLPPSVTLILNKVVCPLHYLYQSDTRVSFTWILPIRFSF